MKHFFHSVLAVVATFLLTAVANAQWSSTEEIGSYQSILARAGYANQTPESLDRNQAGSPASQMSVPTPPGTPMAYTPLPKQETESLSNGFGNTEFVGSEAARDCGNNDCGEAVGNRIGVGNGLRAGGRLNRRGRAGTQPTYNPNVGCAPITGLPTSQTTPVYQPDRAIGRSLFSQVKSPNLVVGTFGVIFRRDYEDGVKLGSCSPGEFSSNDVENGSLTGVGASISQRRANGKGWETIYWGLDEDDSVAITGPTQTSLSSLANLNHIPANATVLDIFDDGDNVGLYRNTEIHSFEFNFLNNGGQYTSRLCKPATYELYGGFRFFKFDEDLRYVSNSSAPGYPATMEYASETENTLTGFQFGGRSEVCVGKRFKLFKGGNVGIFNNRIHMCQRIFDETNYNPVVGSGADAGTPYDLSDTKNDVAFIGQIDFGMIYQFSNSSRLRGGYRAMGVSGVALAGDQIPYNFTDLSAIQSANSNGNLMLHGFYYGAEFCF